MKPIFQESDLLQNQQKKYVSNSKPTIHLINGNFRITKRLEVHQILFLCIRRAARALSAVQLFEPCPSPNLLEK